MNRHGLPREHRLINIQPLRDTHNTIHHDLIPRPHLEQIINNHGFLSNLTRHRLAHHNSRGLRQNTQTIQRALRPQLLDNPHSRVRHDQQTKSTIDNAAGHHHADKQHPQNRINPRHNIRANNIAHRTPRRMLMHIAQTTRRTQRNVRRIQALQRSLRTNNQRGRQHHKPRNTAGRFSARARRASAAS